MRVRTAVPEAPPQNVHAEAEDSSSIRVTWDPPPLEQQNGHIAYYKLYYVEASRPEPEAVEVMLKSPQLSGTEFLLEELKKWTQYRIWLLAGTTVGDGPRSEPITVRTQEDGTRSTAIWRLFRALLGLSRGSSLLATRVLRVLSLFSSSSLPYLPLSAGSVPPFH